MRELAKNITRYALLECGSGYGVSAQILFSMAYKFDPSHLSAHNLGYFYLLQGKCYLITSKWLICGKVNYKRARCFLLKAHKMCPKCFETLCALGELNYRQRKYSDSQKYFEMAIALNFSSGYAHWRKTSLLFLQKKYIDMLHYVSTLESQFESFNDKSMLFFLICAYAEYNVFDCIKSVTLSRITSYVDKMNPDKIDDYMIELLLDAIPILFVSNKFKYVVKCSKLLKLDGYSETIEHMIISSSQNGENLVTPNEIKREFADFPVTNRWYQSLYLQCAD